MSIWQAVILGAVQGITEFLPISSSGHLVLVRAWMALDDVPVLFDVLLHFATLIVVLWVFRSRIMALVAALWRSMVRRSLPGDKPRMILILRLIEASLVTAVIGIAVILQDIQGTPVLTALMMLLTAIILLASRYARSLSDLRFTARFLPFRSTSLPPVQLLRAAYLRLHRSLCRLIRSIARHSTSGRRSSPPPAAVLPKCSHNPIRLSFCLPAAKDTAQAGRLVSGKNQQKSPQSLEVRQSPNGVKSLENISRIPALLIGCAQGLGVLPGISRSGITISAGLFLGLDKKAAGEFSFLLFLPAIFGALLMNLKDVDILSASMPITSLIAGFISALLSGYIFIRLLLWLVVSGKLWVFAFYLFPLGTVALLYFSA